MPKLKPTSQHHSHAWVVGNRRYFYDKISQKKSRRVLENVQSGSLRLTTETQVFLRLIAENFRLFAVFNP
jgi:hypothetical protein